MAVKLVRYEEIEKLCAGGRDYIFKELTQRHSTRFLSYDVGDTFANYIGEEIVLAFDIIITESGIQRNILVYPYQDSGISISTSASLPTKKEWQRFYIRTKIVEYEGTYNGGVIAFYDAAGTNNFYVRNLTVVLGNIKAD